MRWYQSGFGQQGGWPGKGRSESTKMCGPCGSAFFIPVEALGVRRLGVMDPGLTAHGAGMADGQGPHPGISTEGGRRAGRYGPAAGTPVLVRV